MWGLLACIVLFRHDPRDLATSALPIGSSASCGLLLIHQPGDTTAQSHVHVGKTICQRILPRITIRCTTHKTHRLVIQIHSLRVLPSAIRKLAALVFWIGLRSSSDSGQFFLLSNIASTEQPLRLCALLYTPRCNTTNLDIIMCICHFQSYVFVKLRQSRSVIIQTRRVRATASYRISTEGKNLGPA